MGPKAHKNNLIVDYRLNRNKINNLFQPWGVIELHIVHFEVFSILCFIEDTLSIHSASFEINMINIVGTNKSHWGIYIGHFWHPMNLPQFQVHLWKITNLRSILIFDRFPQWEWLRSASHKVNNGPIQFSKERLNLFGSFRVNP